MPRRIRRKLAKKGRRSGLNRRVKARGRKSIMNPQKDLARIVETFEVVTMNSNTPYHASFSINDFDRATSVAGQFQFYRADKVEYIYEAAYNTFQEGNPYVKPYMLETMNRIGEEMVMTKEVLERRGAVPRAFASTIKRVYKPNTLLGQIADKSITQAEDIGIQGQANFSWSPAYNVWQPSEILSTATSVTHPYTNSVVVKPATYYGHDFLIDQPGIEPTLVGRLTIRVHWSFKGARALNDENNTKVVQATQVFQNLAV